MPKLKTLIFLISNMTADFSDNLGFLKAIDDLLQCHQLENLSDCTKANEAIEKMHKIMMDNKGLIYSEYSMNIAEPILECITILTDTVEKQRTLIIVKTIQEKIDNILRVIQDEFNKNGDDVHPDFFTSFSGVYLRDDERYFHLCQDVWSSDYKNKNFIIYSLDLAKKIQEREVNQ